MTEPAETTAVPEKLLTALQASDRGPNEPLVPITLSETDVVILLLNSQGSDWIKYAWLLQNYWGDWPFDGAPGETVDAVTVQRLLNAATGSDEWRKYAWLLQWYWPKKYGGPRCCRPDKISVVERPSEKTS